MWEGRASSDWKAMRGREGLDQLDSSPVPLQLSQLHMEKSRLDLKLKLKLKLKPNDRR